MFVHLTFKRLSELDDDQVETHPDCLAAIGNVIETRSVKAY